jgi:hypothetical protein
MKVEEIIYNHCMGMLNPSPEYYAGRGNSVRDLNSSILELLYQGIKKEIGPDAAKAFVNMVRDLKNTNAQSFLNELYRLERKQWRWADPVLKVRVATVEAGVGMDEEIEQVDEKRPHFTRRVTEIINAFTRSGSLYGHDKAITQDFLNKHKDELNQSLFSSSFGSGGA